ncbi:MAG TPA: ABC transporter substrate-binding protein [Mycobacteriales bacterium]|nr:ABC transporter substrate-binding protein [Mycobacteriales bacterium]
MFALALAAEQTVEATPEAVFALFGAGAGAGWVFDATCDRVATGSVVTMRAPFGGAGGDVEILGRITRIRFPQEIVVAHDLPWRGRLRVVFDAAPGGATRVRLIADLDADGLEWLMRRRGWPVPEEPPPDAHPVGLLTSKSGSGSVFASATENVARLAVEEINADGGIHGRPIRLVVGDDATDVEVGAGEARRLVRAGCRAILATTTSATFARVQREIASTGVLLVHTLMNEGGRGGDLLFQLGERPQDQLRAAIGPLMRESGGRRAFLVGNDYCWPQIVHACARREIARRSGHVVGEGLAPLGSRDFEPMIERILASRADLVVSAFVGADAVAFERQCHAMGLRDRARTLVLALDEPTRERIGDRAAAGLWAVSGYFAELPGEANATFLARYRAAYGRWAPPVSSISESTYEALHLYAAAARNARDDEPRSVSRGLRGRHGFPRGTVTLSGPETFRQDLYLARATAEGFEIVSASCQCDVTY